MKKFSDGSIDMVLCDLPYGTTLCKWDTVIPFDLLWEQYDRVCKPDAAIVLFGQEPFTSFLRLSNVREWRYDWYWEKERLTNIAQVKRRAGKTVETISVFYKKQCVYAPQMSVHTGSLRSNKVKNGKMGKLVDSSEKKVFEYVDTGLRYPTQVLKFQRDCLKSNLHPTQKPLALVEYLVKTYTNKGDTVLDNCMGSGTTGVACKGLNRSFIGIESDVDYFSIAENRIKSS
jgi:DNA modification methylase